uniref:protein disulfide-isomerase n=1 Tax=Timema cristinae TaxID=61476 RepID=A0A7R9DC26_TIMCR|nr:unnamed protein product [Timema cristinae]
MILCKLILLISMFYITLGAEEDVLELGDDDFSTVLGEHDTVLVMFYAPWCGHCKKLKPEYAKAAGLIKGNDPPIALAKVDCTEAGKETCNKHGVTGYPTLKIFRGGEVSQEYNGPREAVGIVKHMKSQVGPSSKDLNKDSELEEFINKEDVAVVGFFEKESDLKSAFLKVADALREKVRFGHTSNRDLLDAVVLFRPKHLHNNHGLVGHRQRDTVNDFSTNYWRNRILKVAKGFADSFSFAISSKDDFQHELNEFGHDYVKGDKPIVFARNEKNQKFIMDGEFTTDHFEKFLTSLKAGELEPYLKSEPVPDSNDGPVKVAVGRNFDEVVTDNGKDTLIEFYAPWCGHCKKLAPIYDELGEKLKDEDVAIVKMDANSNDVSGPYEVRGFPTLYWAPKDKKNSPVKYEGGREVDDFIKYIAKHATNELKGWDRKGKPKKKEEL